MLSVTNQTPPQLQRSDSGLHELAPSTPHSPVATNADYHFPAHDRHRSKSASLLDWTIGRGTVIWRIWHTVLIHTLFAAGVTYASLCTPFHLGVPQVLMTVLGVVIGFVITYRALSGYDRYWLGRCCWSDLVKTSRTMGRLIWLHVPLKLRSDRLNHKSTENCGKGEGEGCKQKDNVKEALRVMEEKRVALDLVEGLVVALKHHLRGESGIHHQDLYGLLQPLRGNSHQRAINIIPSTPTKDVKSTTQASPPRSETAPPTFHPDPPSSPSPNTTLRDRSMATSNTYGTFSSSAHSTNTNLEAAGGNGSVIGPRYSHDHVNNRNNRPHLGIQIQATSSSTSPDPDEQRLRNPPGLVEGSYRSSENLISGHSANANIPTMPVQDHPTNSQQSHTPSEQGPEEENEQDWNIWMNQGYPKVAGGPRGENVPLEVLRCLSEWIEVLEERGVVRDKPLSGMYDCLAKFEDSLSALERILTTPIPFVYSAHIRHTVWIYLFLLPFQLVDQIGWVTIPGVAIAAFFYLGFLAAGEEIEQPFGYDDNDLDLDLFCHDIVHADMEALKRTPCSNASFSDVDGDNRGRSIVEVAKHAMEEPSWVQGELAGSVDMEMNS